LIDDGGRFIENGGQGTYRGGQETVVDKAVEVDVVCVSLMINSGGEKVVGVG
jgi:hypothetical protein